MRTAKIFLIPIALLYGLGVRIRNLFYDLGIFRSQSFEVPTIVVGNLSAGGTGKSPHIEYLIRVLSPHVQVATLSRGYGRSSKGFILADQDSSAKDIGDEPRQFKQKFPDVPVAVEAKRVKGIKKLLEANPDLNVILLDDAFQHRALKPGMSILLTDYHRPYYKDYLLPLGYLRENRKGSNRADIIIVTKTPELFSPLDRRILTRNINPKPYQQVFFSYLKYGEFHPLFPKNTTQKVTKEYYFDRGFGVFLVTGIANPTGLLDFIESKTKKSTHLKFPDHHRFTAADVQKMRKLFDSFAPSEKIILTTEKDAMRLAQPELKELLEDLPIFYIPIEVAFHDKDEEAINELILDHVRRNQIHSQVYSD